MKYKARQLNSGKWAVFANTKEYFTDTVRETKLQADAEALRQSAIWYRDMMDRYRDMMDKAHRQLADMGALDTRDEFGYLA